MSGVSLSESSQQFLEWLESWMEGLPGAHMADITRADGPEGVAIFSVDMVNGFCQEGALFSPRVAGIVQPVVSLFNAAYIAGVRQFILLQDAHPEDSPQFGAWPPHCVAGTAEAETIPELAQLHFARTFQIIPKRSVSPSLDTALDDTLSSRLINTAICVGDCTDLCLYQLAMYLRLRANTRGEALRVMVPADCVQTYDMPQPPEGALPHPGDLMHAVFLYHMQLNGIEIVRKVQV